MEPRLEFKTEAFHAILDETVKVDPRAKKIKPQDLIDRRYIDGMEKNDKLWAGKMIIPMTAVYWTTRSSTISIFCEPTAAGFFL
jgi:hypothetical protein